MTRVNADCVSPPEALNTVLKYPSVIIGDGLNYSDRLPEASLDSCHDGLLPEAQDIFKIACPLIEKGEVIDIQEASPVYLRNQITWKKHKKLRQVK